MAEKIDTADKIAAKILEMLDKGVCPWKKNWHGLVPQSVDGRPYRGINQLLLGFTSYECPRFLTFNRCKALGGKVKKGEHGHLVMFWKRFTKEETDEKTGETKKTSFMCIRGYTVFNVAQCEGLPKKFYDVSKMRVEHKPIAEAEALWKGYEDKPQVVFTKGDTACYVPNLDVINCPEMSLFDSAEAFYATLFHEGCHSTGHKSRLNRDLGGNFGSERYGKEELVAEIGAQLLCQQVGIENQMENTAAYCKSWAKALRGMRSKEIIYAASRAQKAADYIMGKKSEYDEPKTANEVED